MIKMDTTYDIRAFVWTKETNTFYGDAWTLQLGDKEPFIIKNSATGGSRRFVFHRELAAYWIFKSEDSILCEICLDPNGEFPRDEYEYLFQ